jgi:hypothetical protein
MSSKGPFLAIAGLVGSGIRRPAAPKSVRQQAVAQGYQGLAPSGVDRSIDGSVR